MMEYQDEKEFNVLLREIKDLNPKSVLEIGSMFGDTLRQWICIADNICSIDIPLPRSDSRAERQSQEVLNSKGLAERAHKNLLVISADSHNSQTLQRAREFFKDGIDFLFIDGDHSYNGVKQDYEMYAPLVNPGGIVAFHDVRGLEEVNRFWNEIKVGKPYCEIYRSIYGWGIGILYV